LLDHASFPRGDFGEGYADRFARLRDEIKGLEVAGLQLERVGSAYKDSDQRRHLDAVLVLECTDRHADCAKSSMPKTRVEFWTAKFSANVTRDASNMMALERLGWSVLTIWECETRSAKGLALSLAAFLEDQVS
jgi:G:T-mismatch repair DNA endonuclease (very short patch repair protein)